MHPRLQQLFSLIKHLDATQVLNFEVLQLLKENGASYVEATMTLYYGFHLDGNVIDKCALESQLWGAQDLNSRMIEVAKFMFYDPNDPNYKDENGKLTVSI